jgi:hypothetical protein
MVGSRQAWRRGTAASAPKADKRSPELGTCRDRADLVHVTANVASVALLIGFLTNVSLPLHLVRMRVLCVAEKPSISKSITQILSGGRYTTVGLHFYHKHHVVYPEQSTTPSHHSSKTTNLITRRPTLSLSSPVWLDIC